MKKILLYGLLLIANGIVAQSIAKGTIFEDTNNDKKKNHNEKGVANVGVSNGKDVVLTNSKGEYQLPVNNDAIIFVIKPVGYSFSMDENNSPLFYYLHKPEGSPQLQYKGVSATGKLPKSIDFALTKVAEHNEFSCFIFGDPQPYIKEHIDFFSKAIVNEIVSNGTKKAIFGISLGDLVGDDLNLHLPYKQAIKPLGLPWYNVMGNHDMNYDAKVDSLSDETFEAHFGPNNYSFNYGNAHFIVLDNILYPDPRDEKGYWGGLRKDQLAFLKNDLKYVDKDKLIVISLHIPLDNKEEGDEAFRQNDRTALYNLVKEHKQVLVLSAHTHIQYQALSGKKEGIERENAIHEFNVGATCGDWYSGIITEKGTPVTTMRDGTPQGYALLKITGNKYELDYKVAGMPENYKMSIYHAKKVPFSKYGSSYNVYANVFMASPTDEVKYRIDKGSWLKMEKVNEIDPTYNRYVQDWDYLETLVPGRRPSDPIICLHLWKAPLEVNLPIGKHQIEISTKDMFGRTFTQTSIYQIDEDPTLKLIKQ